MDQSLRNGETIMGLIAFAVAFGLVFTFQRAVRYARNVHIVPAVFVTLLFSLFVGALSGMLVGGGTALLFHYQPMTLVDLMKKGVFIFTPLMVVVSFVYLLRPRFESRRASHTT